MPGGFQPQNSRFPPAPKLVIDESDVGPVHKTPGGHPNGPPAEGLASPPLYINRTYFAHRGLVGLSDRIPKRLADARAK